ncbi:unnamed protein product [Oppiella nova]|uniref:RNA exonuclease 4 n=1 Tax=Oppiella nova TaxID=334625 RepID=A0A7R9M598_9ACAR|nr:unnamed protein product [Oppiella nova]CAG2169734.1 unnamed protein product [Oppiella nova]
MAKNKRKVSEKESKDAKVVHKRRRRPTKHVKTTVCKYPQEVNEMSANWKRLSQELNEKKDNNNNKKKRFDPKVVKKKGFNDKKVNESKSDDKNKIWFDGVDKCLIKSSMSDTNASNGETNEERLVKQKSFSGLTKVVGMDCEMVGTGSDGTNSVLARVSIVNFFGHCIYDKYVKALEEITDYRTEWSGIRPKDLVNALDFKTVQTEVHQILKERTVVGHALHNDFKALLLSHPKHKTRDTSRYFKKLFGGRNPALKRLSESVLGVRVQTGEHNSVEDARVAMRLYTMFRKKWESDLKKTSIKKAKKTDK